MLRPFGVYVVRSTQADPGIVLACAFATLATAGTARGAKAAVSWCREFVRRVERVGSLLVVGTVRPDPFAVADAYEVRLRAIMPRL